MRRRRLRDVNPNHNHLPPASSSRPLTRAEISGSEDRRQSRISSFEFPSGCHGRHHRPPAPPPPPGPPSGSALCIPRAHPGPAFHAATALAAIVISVTSILRRKSGGIHHRLALLLRQYVCESAIVMNTCIGRDRCNLIARTAAPLPPVLGKVGNPSYANSVVPPPPRRAPRETRDATAFRRRFLLCARLRSRRGPSPSRRRRRIVRSFPHLGPAPCHEAGHSPAFPASRDELAA